MEKVHYFSKTPGTLILNVLKQICIRHSPIKNLESLNKYELDPHASEIVNVLKRYELDTHPSEILVSELRSKSE